MVSYYDRNMTHAIYFWVLMNTNMDVFLECRYRFDAEMGDSTLICHMKELFWTLQCLYGRSGLLESPE
jgi:hypothetical protein